MKKKMLISLEEKDPIMNNYTRTEEQDRRDYNVTSPALPHGEFKVDFPFSSIDLKKMISRPLEKEWLRALNSVLPFCSRCDSENIFGINLTYTPRQLWRRERIWCDEKAFRISEQLRGAYFGDFRVCVNYLGPEGPENYALLAHGYTGGRGLLLGTIFPDELRGLFGRHPKKPIEFKVKFVHENEGFKIGELEIVLSLFS